MMRGYIVEVERRSAQGPCTYTRHVCPTVAAVAQVVAAALRQRRCTGLLARRRVAGEE